MLHSKDKKSGKEPQTRFQPRSVFLGIREHFGNGETGLRIHTDTSVPALQILQ